ncbi:unnamed protein product [Brassicogethes aeneus]|uniref:Cytochrome P450 n=1 Tax=Brassicogethes aeneus TaxID=1431903 RepID=A0A9P0BDX4_BRAAE|nr:unnamed protein product [Brassicogethes aeneus]
MIEVLILVVVILSIYLRNKEYNHREKYKGFYKLPTPSSSLPLLGNAHLFVGKNVLDIFSELVNTCGAPCYAHLPGRFYITASPEEYKIILNHPNSMGKSTTYNFVGRLFASSLLMAPDHQWKKNRKFLSKGFNQMILDSFVTVFYEKSEYFNVKLKNIDYDQNDIYSLFEKYTLDVFCEATLGIETKLIDEDDCEIVNFITKGQRILIGRLSNVFKHSDILFNLTEDGKYINESSQHFYNFVLDIIAKKRKMIAEGQDIMAQTNKLPVLDLLLSEKEAFEDNYIKEEMLLFAAAATDTTAYSMAYTCCLLGMHPEIQEKVLTEVMDAIGKDREITCNDLHQLKYTEMAISEAMRLIPVVPMIGRRAVGDIDLGTRVIPANTDVVCLFINTHRNEKYYPNPKKYDPRRFLPEEVAKRPQYSYLAFSGGPRNCIGMKYAMMVMKTTIANIVRNFHITTKYKSIDELEFESSIIMTTKHPLDCHFTPRK